MHQSTANPKELIYVACFGIAIRDNQACAESVGLLSAIIAKHAPRPNELADFIETMAIVRGLRAQLSAANERAEKAEKLHLAQIHLCQDVCHELNEAEIDNSDIAEGVAVLRERLNALRKAAQAFINRCESTEGQAFYDRVKAELVTLECALAQGEVT